MRVTGLIPGCLVALMALGGCLTLAPADAASQDECGMVVATLAYLDDRPLAQLSVSRLARPLRPPFLGEPYAPVETSTRAIDLTGCGLARELTSEKDAAIVFGRPERHHDYVIVPFRGPGDTDFKGEVQARDAEGKWRHQSTYITVY